MTSFILEKIPSFFRTGRYSTLSLLSKGTFRIIFRNYWSFCFEEIPVFSFSVKKQSKARPFDSVRFALFGFEVVFFFYKQ
ncbi:MULTISPECIES: hypothetical protein [Leptospira]|uniref:Uncharacterized protein n=1 Tax=Leptospira weilii str. UI 13098 TaxID=1088542 RepID=M6Q1Z1_9LEPT|nr:MULTISPECIES: hypothetical protein [Leptospira]EMJ64562.1 hypothetical protein LEP1GSC051_2136 [Leptospira sp. P2653]EMN89526.1 hypothetical protein LEP1GSC108_0017 [Leptospira weilii str. UI 13098]